MLAFQNIRRAAGRFFKWVKFFGSNYYCPLCRKTTRLMTPSSGSKGQEVVARYSIVAMGQRPHYRCPWCNSSDKERLVWAYLQSKTDFLITERKFSLLHIAPERNTRNFFKSRSNISYVMGDKFEGAAKYTSEHYGGAQYLDVTDLGNFKENYFDLIICNHVLEHVPHDRKAMKEIYRVLKPGGQAILQVPVSRVLSESIEDPSVKSPEEKLATFGQSDHVRVYAERDYLGRLKASGFTTAAWHPVDLLEPTEVRRWGINEEERVYVAEKPY